MEEITADVMETAGELELKGGFRRDLQKDLGTPKSFSRPQPAGRDRDKPGMIVQGSRLSLCCWLGSCTKV